MLEQNDIMRKTMAAEAAPEPEKRGRKASKEARRQQLIEATIDSLSKRGYSETTLADIADVLAEPAGCQLLDHHPDAPVPDRLAPRPRERPGHEQ